MIPIDNASFSEILIIKLIKGIFCILTNRVKAVTLKLWEILNIQE